MIKMKFCFYVHVGEGRDKDETKEAYLCGAALLVAVCACRLRGAGGKTDHGHTDHGTDHSAHSRAHTAFDRAN